MDLELTPFWGLELATVFNLNIKNMKTDNRNILILFFSLIFSIMIGNKLVAQPWQNQISNYSFEKKLKVKTKYTSDESVNLKKDSINNSKNAVFAEILGGGGYYSFGYERTILNYQRYELLTSVGFTNIHFIKPRFSFGFPLSINNRFKFWRFNSIDVGLTLSEFFNIWSIIDQDKYFDCPTGECIAKVLLMPSFHVGWTFRLNKITISPRFYGFLYTSLHKNNLKAEPYFGLRGSYSF